MKIKSTVHTIGKIYPGGAKNGWFNSLYVSIEFIVRNEESAPTPKLIPKLAISDFNFTIILSPF